MKVSMTDKDVRVRLSHLLRECSVGAIVRDGVDSLMVVQDIRTWDRPGSDPMDREIRYVERVRSALGIEQALCSPPRATERDGTTLGWIPALKFPIWMRCLKCGLLHRAPWRARRGARSCWGAKEEAVHAAGDLSRCPGFSFTKRAIWRTCPGTTWPTLILAILSGAGVALIGRNPICD